MKNLIVLFLIVFTLCCGCSMTLKNNDVNATKQQLELVTKAATSMGVVKFLNKNPKWIAPTKKVVSELSQEIITFTGNLQEFKNIVNNKINYDAMDNEEREFAIALVDLGFMMLVPDTNIALNLVQVDSDVKEKVGKYIGWVMDAVNRYKEK